MSEARPKVSVVIPTLNRAAYLRETIESVLRQDYEPLECIVIDGGSTDGSLEIIEEYDDRIEWLSEPDEGHADAINKGWSIASGEVLAWLNADDRYLIPDAVGRGIRCLTASGSADVVYGDYRIIDESGNVLRDRVRPPGWDLKRAVEYCDYTIPQPTSFIRRRILERVDYLDEDFGNGKDHELWLRIGLEGSIKYCPEIIAEERDVPGLSETESMARAKIRVTEKFLSRSDLPADFTSDGFRRRALSNSYFEAAKYIWTGNASSWKMGIYIGKALLCDPTNALNILGRMVRLAGIMLWNRTGRRLRRRAGGVT